MISDKSELGMERDQKSRVKIFKPRRHNVLSTGTNTVKTWLSLYLKGCVMFARYCGKMYSTHLFSYGGLGTTDRRRLTERGWRGGGGGRQF